MQKSIELLTSYVPSLIIEHFSEDPTPLKDPLEKRFKAAVFFADISGFTRLAEKLAEKGVSGAEELTRLLNNYFGQMISLIGSHGGDIVKFAGDALFAIWYNDQEDLEDAVTRATLCALEISNSLNDYEIDDNLRLYVRVSIGAGDILAASVGGVLKRWEFLIAGPPLKQVGVANDVAAPGQVILSSEAWEIAEASVSGTILHNEDNLFLAESVPNAPRLRPLPQFEIDPDSITGLQGFVSGAILNRMAVVGEAAWLAEHRRISVIFMQITNLDFTQPDAVQNLQNIMREAQVTLYHYEGSVRQLIEDDKGTVFIAVFGLPPYTHRDDPVRAITASLAMQNKLQKLGFTSRIGITTGHAFCGPIGNTLRREYAMVGSVVNLSARLMGATKKLDTTLLVDETTYQAAKSRLAFQKMTPIALKNIAGPVVTYAPYGDDAQVESSLRPLVGRLQERDELSRYLQALRNGESHIVLIEGKSGVGKTRLVRDLIEQADAHNIFNITGNAASIEKNTPYHVWNEIFSKLFDTKINARTTMRRQSVVKNLMKNKEIMQYLPLLNSVLHLDLPENPQTSDLSASMRMRTLRKLMLDIIEAAADNKPTVLILENVQWMDLNSWNFASAIKEQLSPVLMVLVGRPIEGKEQEARQILTSQISSKIELEPLSKNETAQLVSFCLGVAQIAPEIADLIYGQSQGNPFFSEEIAYALRDSNNIVQVEGTYRLDKKASNTMSPTGEIHLNVPDTLQGIITSRIDRLAPEIELTLKTASVIGPSFNARVLRDIFPLDTHKAKIYDYLAELDDLELIEAPQTAGETEYHFRQTLMHEVTYNLIPFTQRRELHEEVARWYEKNYVYDLSPYYQFLAYHWGQAGNQQQTFKYYEKAGEQSLQNGAYQEAIDIFSQAIERIQTSDNTINTVYRLAHWEGSLAEAYWGLSNMASAEKHALKALKWLNYELPSADELRGAIYREVIEQGKHRLMPQRFLGSAENIPLISEATRAFRILVEIYYFADKGNEAIYCGLRVLNLAETLGEKHPELARAYANIYVGFSLRQQNRFARVYKRLALSTIEKLNKPNISAPVLTRIGMYDVIKGQWTSARGFIEQAANLYKRAEEKRGWSDTQLLLGFLNYFQADFWEGGGIFDEVAINAQRINNLDHRILGLSGYALHLLALDKLRLAMGQLQQAKPHWDNPSVQNATAFFSQALFAVAILRSGHLPRAHDAAKDALHRLPNAYRRIDPSAFLGTFALMDVFLELHQADAHRADAENYLAILHEGLLRYKQHFTAVHPYINLLDGRYALQMGHADNAHKLFDKALKQSQANSLPWVTGYSYFALAQIETHQAKKADYLALALEVLEEAQATYDVNRVRQYIRQSES